MEHDEFDELLALGRQVAAFLKTAYEDVTDEELGLESALRHYPLLVIGVAAGAGAVAGFWFGRKVRPPTPLPPPKPSRPIDRALDSAKEIGERIKQRRAATPEGQPLSAFDYFEAVMPERAEQVRRALPEGATEQAAEKAREWVEGTLEPRVQLGLERMAARASASKLGKKFKETVQRLEIPPEDHELPEEPPGDGSAGPTV